MESDVSMHIVSCICKKQQCIIIFRSSQIRGILSVAKLLTNASLFIFDWIIKVAGNKDMHKSLQEFDFWHIQTADIVELIGPEKTIAPLLENYSKYFNDFTWWLSGEGLLPFGLLVYLSMSYRVQIKSDWLWT